MPLKKSDLRSFSGAINDYYCTIAYYYMKIQLINDNLLSDLHNQAQTSERKRRNFDLRTSQDDTLQRMLNVLEPGTFLYIDI